MFYSQTFLARKGPLGTVWCAAHLQHRLKKSHYTSTDINSVVDRILCPDVPIALRMSGHLLLGVTRIYSKKVEYLLHDCNVMMVVLKKALTAAELSLAENDRTATFESVTLPQTFNLDDVEFDYDGCFNGSPDSNLKSRDEITLADQIPTGVEPFVAITFDDDLTDDTPPSGPATDLGTIPETEDIFPTYTSTDFDENRETSVPSNRTEVHTETEEQLQDTGPNNQTEVPTQVGDHTDVNTEVDESGQSNVTINLDSRATDNDSSPDFGILRDTVHDFGPDKLPHLSPIREKNPIDANIVSEQELLEKEITSPITREPFPSREPSFQLRLHSEPPSSGPSGGDPPFSVANSPPGETTPGLHLAASPLVQQQQAPVQPPQPRRRKRNIFDENRIVLTNEYVGRCLENCTDLLRTKRNAPSSALDVWRQNKKSRKEQVFHEPLITGMSAELSSFFEEGHNFVNHLAIHHEEDTTEIHGRTSPVRDVDPEPANPNPSSPAATEVISSRNVTSSVPEDVDTVVEPTDGNSMVRDDMDIDSTEQIRNVGSHHDDLPEFHHSPPHHSPLHPRQDDSTPSPQHFQSTIETLAAGHTARSEIQQTTDVATSIGTYISGLMTPRTNEDDPFSIEDTQLSHILELRDSPEMEDFYSSEADNTPAGSSRKSGKGGHQLSGRTRAVAQYLERQSPITPRMDDPTKEISLNKILQGKPRKLCARMFYETLVLKSHGVVEVEREDPQERIRLKFDVEQAEPYGDILLKLCRLA